MIYLLGPGILVRVCSTLLQPSRSGRRRRNMEGKYLVGFLGLHQVLLVWAGGRVGEKKGWSAIMARVPGQQEKQY